MIWNLCINRPVFTMVIFATITIFGAFGYTQLPVQENPDVDFPIVSVTVTLPGASPEVMETEVLEVLEEQINTIEGLKELRSTARQEVATVTAEFELWRNIDIAAQDVRDRVDRVRNDLPDDIDAPLIQKIDPDEQAIMWFSLVGDQRWDAVRLAEYADDYIKPQVENIAGVGRIQIGGVTGSAVRIRLDPQKLAAYKMTVTEVVQAIQANNVDIPSGRVESTSREFTVRTIGQFSNAAPFNDLIVGEYQGTAIRLSDVGRAYDGSDSTRRIARFTGATTVGIGVVRQSSANTVELAEAVKARLAEVEKTLPGGLELHVATDSSRFIKESIDDLLFTIVLATLIVVAVVYGFLRTGRGTIIVAIAIPTSLLAAVAGMDIMGFSLNQLSMLALILVIGIVVDDAIVVLERAVWHVENGADPKAAARVGTTEIAFPAIANSMALAAVFLPVAFMGGMIGQYFMEFGMTVVLAVLASTFTALTLTPMMCAKMLSKNEKKGAFFEWSERMFENVEERYSHILAWSLNHRLSTVGISVASFALGILALMNLPSEFAPQPDRSELRIMFQTPEGSTIDETDDYARRIEKVLRETPEVSHQFLAIGLSQGGPGRVNEGISFVKLVMPEKRDLHQEEVMQVLREKLAEIPNGRAFVFEQQGGGGGNQSPLEIVLLSPQLDTLVDLQEDIMSWMRQQPEFIGVRSDLEVNRPEVRVHINREKASQMGIAVSDVANTMRLLLGEPQISSIERNSKRYDVITEIEGKGELTPSVIRNLYVRDARGNLIALDNIVEVEEGAGPSEIHHTNRMRSAGISASTPPGVPLGDALAKLEGHLEDNMPAGTNYELAGQAKRFQESFGYLLVAVGFAVTFIFLVLAAQFESWISPLTIMTALPLAAAGAFIALWLLAIPVSIYAFIGLIVLMGLVTKNGILLVDYTNVLRARGYELYEAAYEGGKTRLRPVLMTALSTVLGMLPIALGLGAGGEARVGMGVAVAAGLLFSTALTLVLVPVVYTYLDNWREAIARRLKGGSAKGSRAHGPAE
ncbi:efflux RND transporter permease subunit [Tepidicaulis sp. LMO-SS28]|uniref:efflux RND transporter permease subunit n=1 Tax=Tepidicaulis sp. LMO-SS28 TaxID=3447455 RepID=UPI003EE16E42